MINYWSATAAERAAALEDNEIDALQCTTGANYSDAAALVAERHQKDTGLAWATTKARHMGAVPLAHIGVESTVADPTEL